MKTKVLVLLLLAGTSLFARTHVSIGIGIGGFYPYGYYAPPPVYYAPPPVYYAPSPVYYAPAPAYYAPAPVYPAYGSVWISGYYYPYGGRRVWRPGYWGRRPFAGAAWVSPYWVGGRLIPRGILAAVVRTRTERAPRPSAAGQARCRKTARRS